MEKGYIETQMVCNDCDEVFEADVTDVWECECGERFREGDGEGEDGNLCPICCEVTELEEVDEGCCPECLGNDIDEVECVFCDRCQEYIRIE